MAPMLKPMRLPVTKAHNSSRESNDAILLEENRSACGSAAASCPYRLAEASAIGSAGRRSTSTLVAPSSIRCCFVWARPLSFSVQRMDFQRSFQGGTRVHAEPLTCRGESHHKRVQLLGRTTKVSSEALRPCHVAISHLLCCTCASLAQNVYTSKML